MTNDDLLVEANAAYEEAALLMHETYDKLFAILDDEQRKELEAAQAAWSFFAEKQSIFSAGLMRGGTGESLLYLQEINSLTRSRVTALQESLAERSLA